MTKSTYDRWCSPRSKQNYPTRRVITILEESARLEVISAIREQEIVSKHPALHKYEAACAVSEIYQDKPTLGHCYAELLGPRK